MHAANCTKPRTSAICTPYALLPIIRKVPFFVRRLVRNVPDILFVPPFPLVHSHLRLEILFARAVHKSCPQPHANGSLCYACPVYVRLSGFCAVGRPSPHRIPISRWAIKAVCFFFRPIIASRCRSVVCCRFAARHLSVRLKHTARQCASSVLCPLNSFCAVGRPSPHRIPISRWAIKAVCFFFRPIIASRCRSVVCSYFAARRLSALLKHTAR